MKCFGTLTWDVVWIGVNDGTDGGDGGRGLVGPDDVFA